MRSAANPEAGRGVMVILHVTDRCDLSCPYCYAGKGGRRDMPLSVAEKAVEWAVKRFGPGATLVFIGGEPLLRLDLIRKVTASARAAGITRFIVPTNGTLFDRETAGFFAENGISPTFHFFTVPRMRRLMDLLGENRAAWANKADPDPPRIRFNLLPGKVREAAANVSRVLEHPASDLFIMDFMPAMGGTLWRQAGPGHACAATLSAEFLRLAEKFAARFRRGERTAVSAGECLSERASFLAPPGAGRAFCGSGVRKFSVDARGDVYPCYLAAADPEANRRFVLGNVFGGGLSAAAARDFNGAAENRSLSCLYWNRLYTGDPGRPAGIYRAVSAALGEANALIEKRLSGAEPCDREKTGRVMFVKSEFGLKTDAQMEKFLALLNRSPGAGLECSHKVRGGRVQSARFNVWYEGPERAKAQGLIEIFAHLRGLASLPGARIDASAAGRLVKEGLDLSRVWKIGFGTDFRENPRESRVKIWFFARRYPELADRAASLAGKYGIKALPGGRRRPFIFGFYMGLDGSVSVKYYALYQGAELRRLPASGLFGKKVSALAGACSQFYVAPREEGESVLNFFPKDPAGFFARLDVPGLDELNRRCLKGGTPVMGISFKEAELLRGRPENYNLYY